MDLEKNKDRVKIMLRHTCGCTREESIIVLNECKKDLEREMEEPKRK